jgi:DNA-binding NarL/FixJ family response regulator
MEQESPVRVLLVDDLFIVRQTLRCVLQPYSNIEVVGEAGDGDEAVKYVARLQPDVVIMDVNMTKMDGITAARLIKTQYPHVLVVGFSADLKDYDICAMQQAGVCEVLRKEDAMKDLYGAIQRAVTAVHSHPTP